jgi:hypothetical protein
MKTYWAILAAMLTLLLTVSDPASAAQFQRRSTSTMMKPVNRPAMKSTSRTMRTNTERKFSGDSKRTKSKSVTRSNDMKRETSTKSGSNFKKDSGSQQTTTRDFKGTTPSAGITARESKKALTFDGKPSNVAHDATRQASNAKNDLGNINDHKDTTIKRDDGYFRRSYYSSKDDEGRRTWYWYDSPLIETEILLTERQSAPFCGDGSNVCQYAGGYTPVKVNTCGTDRKTTTDTNGLSHTVVSCFSRGADDPDLSCDGTCHVMDPSGADQGVGPVDAGAGSGPPNPNRFNYGCLCK